jgi:voltage-gated potassium channel
MKTEGIGPIGVPGQIWLMLLIIVGVGTAMIALTTFASMIVEGQIRSLLGRRTVNIKIASLTNHYIVCGYGAMGRSLCERLRQYRALLVVIDRDPAVTAQADADGFLYILGDASEEHTLRNAGVERARGLVTVLPTDGDNVFVTLVARDLAPRLFIAARAEKLNSEPRLVRAGANKAICPHEIGARRAANILTRPGVVDFLDFAAEGLDLEAEQYVLEEGNRLIGQSLRQANLPREIGLLVVALKRQGGQTIFNPHPDTTLETEDTLIVIGKPGSLAELAKRFS